MRDHTRSALPISALTNGSNQSIVSSQMASDKLNGAVCSTGQRGDPSIVVCHAGASLCTGCSIHSPLKRTVQVSVANCIGESPDDDLTMSQLRIRTSPVSSHFSHYVQEKPLLPSLHVSHSTPNHSRHRTTSSGTSPSLAMYSMASNNGYLPPTLPRLHNVVNGSLHPISTHESGQVLPSLETALSATRDSNGTPYFDPSLELPRPSPSLSATYSLSPRPQSALATHMSPPRLASNPGWRTLSHESSTSNSSEATGSGTAASSTPAYRHSPPYSISTSPLYPASDHSGSSELESGPDTSFHGLSSSSGFYCTFPNCTAAPFQTQYLLNSHQNVHSTQRPHFCPVEGCPRSAGGQGFKRKNEMIRYVCSQIKPNLLTLNRHGLVHQSPGYICPFCPDQQHRYPRPDNLQRHVRVHHVDRDKDDSMLRDVLAQRPEGGSRGRRRRMM